MKPNNIGVVVTTYNSPEWLRKVLLGYEAQTYPEFTVIVADDGSSQPTFDVIEEFKQRGKLKLQHVWHPDDGFRKCTILNKAIAQTDCDYLIFTDGDCIPEPSFVSVHAQLAQPGHFLSGGYIKLTMPISLGITDEDIANGRIFEPRWLRAQGQPADHKLWKLVRKPWLKKLLNTLTTAKPTWNGMNSSTWTEEIRAINGFNEDMQYGGLDRELGERLFNRGIKSIQIRYSVVCLHLDHARSYAKPEIWARNRAIRREVRTTRRTWTPNGIVKSPQPSPTAKVG